MVSGWLVKKGSEHMKTWNVNLSNVELNMLLWALSYYVDDDGWGDRPAANDLAHKLLDYLDPNYEHDEFRKMFKK